MTDLAKEFENAMLDIYEQAARLNYRATYFLRMVHERGGVGAAKHLLAGNGTQTGLFRLAELKRLDLSMEALVIQDKYAPLFTTEEIATAHRRLKDLNYFK